LASQKYGDGLMGKLHGVKDEEAGIVHEFSAAP